MEPTSGGPQRETRLSIVRAEARARVMSGELAHAQAAYLLEDGSHLGPAHS